MPDVQDWREVVVKFEEIQALVLECRGGCRDDGFLGIKGVYAPHSYCNIAILSWLYGEVFINYSVRILSRMCEYVFIA